jgi:transposase
MRGRSRRRVGSGRTVRRTGPLRSSVTYGRCSGFGTKLVRTRAGVITLVQAVLSREGIRVPTGSSECFSARLEKLELTEHLGSKISPLLALVGPLNEQIERLDERLGELAVKDKRVARLQTVPQIGPVTAVSFVATLDEVGRFRGAHQVEAYLGLVPREWSSSEVQRRGRITKAGNSRMRWLLVEAAWRVEKRPETVALREWADRIARRRGMRVAVVALARKLGGILYAMWRDGSAYDPAKLGGTQGTSATLAA